MNGGMTWGRRAILLAAALVAVFVLCPRATVVRWMCEGRVCGISVGDIARCCCDAGNAALRDNDCKGVRSIPATEADSANGADGCGCVAVAVNVQGDGHDSHGHAPPPGVTLPDSPAILAILVETAAVYVPPFVSETAVCTIETRGPPFWRIPPSSLGLRAPPFA